MRPLGRAMRARSIARRWFPAVAGLLLIAVALAGAGPAAASAVGCEAWTGAQPASPGTVDNALSSVAVLSPCDVWAAGFDLSGGAFQTLIEHWNGFSWTPVDSPDPGSGNNFLNSIHAASPSSVWAVGSASDATGSKTLIEHWNGTAWKTVPSPSPGNGFNELGGVWAVSANDAWAVGDYSGRAGTSRKTLILHWNGVTWKQVASPDPAGTGNDNDLFAVAASSRKDAWAVGEIVTTTGIRTLVVHWNGRKWARVASPNPAAANELMAVGVASSANAWAVGFVEAGSGEQTFVLHWNGRRWARVPSPNAGGPGHDNVLVGVAARSAGSAWAVGDFTGSGASQALALHCC